MVTNSTGTLNVATGGSALRLNTTGSSNTAVGVSALFSNTTASSNTALGYVALYSNQTGASNTAVGRSALYATTGGLNTAIGENAGGAITTGTKNTILGRYNGNQGGLDIRTSSNRIVLSDGDGNPAMYVEGGTYPRARMGLNVATTYNSAVLKLERDDVGYSTVIATRHGNTAARFHMSFHNSAGEQGNITCNSSSVSYNSTSDYRLKENVVDLTNATERLKQLQPRRFNFIADTAEKTVDGFLAHEVQEIVPEAVTGLKDALKENGEPEYQSMDASKLVPLLVATIKELEARIAALEAN